MHMFQEKIKNKYLFSCRSVAKLCLALCVPMNCSMPGFPTLRYLLKFAQTHVHRINDAIQISIYLFNRDGKSLIHI